jgi:hypothetical protein
MSSIGFAETAFLEEHCVLGAITCRLEDIYQNFIGMRFIRLQPNKMTLQIEEVIFCDVLTCQYQHMHNFNVTG